MVTGRRKKSGGSARSRPHKPRSGRPSQPLITRDIAIGTALDLIDEGGLHALSVLGVARRIGVTAPSLYHHVRDKQELLNQVALRLLDEVSSTTREWADDWEERTIELSVAMRRVALRHPNAAPLILRFFPRKLMLPAYERQLADCPYPPEAHLAILELVEKLTFGSALFAAAAETNGAPAMPEVDASRYPLLHRAVGAVEYDEEQLHIETLKAALDGVRARYGRRPSA